MKTMTTKKVMTITLTNGDVYQVDKSHKLYPKVLAATKAKDEKKVVVLLDKMKIAVQWAGKEFERRGSVFYYKGQPLHTILTEYISSLMDKDIDSSRFVKFLENVMGNPDKNVRDQIWSFLQACQMPIDQDGCIIAYKWVNENYTDVHTGTFDNHPGKVLKMNRSQADSDPNQSCSTGFHACSRNYHKFGARLLEVRINPKDVVSVPKDYNASKMRVCEYKVLCEVGVENYAIQPESLAYEKKKIRKTPKANAKAKKKTTKKVVKKSQPKTKATKGKKK